MKQPRHVAMLAVVLTASAIAGCARQGDPKPRSSARLLSDVDAVAAGRTFKLGVLISVASGWHSYWRNPGDAGLAPHIAWHLPEGFQVGKLSWPVPQRLGEAPVVSFAYEEDVLLAAEVTAPHALPAAGDTVTLGATVSWLACEDACVPFDAELSLSLPIREGSTAASPDAPRFAAAAANCPTPLPPTAWRVDVDPQGWLVLHVHGTLPAPTERAPRPAFFPITPPDTRLGDDLQAQRLNGELALRLAQTKALPPDVRVLEGVVDLGAAQAGGNRRAFTIRVPIDDTRAK